MLKIWFLIFFINYSQWLPCVIISLFDFWCFIVCITTKINPIFNKSKLFLTSQERGIRVLLLKILNWQENIGTSFFIPVRLFSQNKLKLEKKKTQSNDCPNWFKRILSCTTKRSICCIHCFITFWTRQRSQCFPVS